VRQGYASARLTPRSADPVLRDGHRAPDRGRLLLVGVSRGERGRLTRALGASGFRAVCVNDGAEALICLHRGGIAAVLLPDDLPGIRGLALLPGIRMAWPELPVIFVRPSGETANGGETLGNGAYACLEAPVRAAELLTALREGVPVPAAGQSRSVARGEALEPQGRTVSSTAID
jgi:DNA-binding response OmpR family regulator